MIAGSISRIDAHDWCRGVIEFWINTRWGHMSTSETDQEFRKEVAGLKDADLRWHNRIHWVIVVWLILGVVVGVGTWFSQKPIDRDEIMFGGVFGLGFAVWFFGCMLGRMRFPRPAIKCPQCGNDWTLSDDYPINLLTWKCCPGCGLKISDDVAWHEKS